MQTNKKRHTRRDTGRSMLCRRGHNTIGLVQRRCTCMMQTSIYPACWLRQQQQQQQQQQQPLLPTACPFLSAFLPCLCSRSSSNFHFVQPPRERHQRKWRQSELAVSSREEAIIRCGGAKARRALLQRHIALGNRRCCGEWRAVGLRDGRCGLRLGRKVRQQRVHTHRTADDNERTYHLQVCNQSVILIFTTRAQLHHNTMMRVDGIG